MEGKKKRERFFIPVSQQLKYRPEIDGLRAVAVAGVIVFHLDPSWLKGGFLGVDVFFVISGFLITSLLQKAMEKGDFSFKEFWARRIRRLYPALMVMVAVVALVGNFVLINSSRRELFAQSLAAIFSLSNIWLWKNTGGYWQSDSADMALLHTWSLSLEEQFYIVFPVLLFFANKIPRKFLTLFIGIVLLASLWLCLTMTGAYRSAAFYLLPTRMWELLAGGLLALTQHNILTRTNHPAQAIAALAGIVTILISFFLIENSAGFPGWYPIVPCLGTVLILAFGQARGGAHAILSAKPTVYLGKISYSLYLWHWPTIVFSEFLSVKDHTLTVVAATIGLGCLSYHFVETPFRKGFRGSWAGIWALPVMVGICLIPLKVMQTNPTVSEDLANIQSSSLGKRGRAFEAPKTQKNQLSGVVVGDSSQAPQVVLLGSSHARCLAPPFAEFLNSEHVPALVMASSGVGLTSISNADEREVNNRRLEQLSDLHPKLVLVAGAWSMEMTDGFKEEMKRRLAQLSKSSNKVLVISQVPQCSLPGKYKYSLLKYALAANRSDMKLEISPSEEALKANRIVQGIVQEMNLKNVVFVNIYDSLIDAKGRIRLIDHGVFLYSDYHHINEDGASYVFEKSLKKILKESLGEVNSE